MTTTSVRVDGDDQVGEARRAAVDLAKLTGFNETDVGRVAIVATECATNLWKHGGGGELLAADPEFGGKRFIEITALDRGPGMPNLVQCFEDGYSTSGTAGGGLGAVARLAECKVYSRPGVGSAVLARIQPTQHSPHAESPFTWGGLSVPIPGETVCGDTFSVRQHGAALVAMMVDGLGHGQAAAECALRAAEAFAASAEFQPARLVEDIHRALRGTRGAAVSVALLDAAARRIHFAGVGNVLGVVTAHASARNFVSMPGIAGDRMRGVREFTYEWPINGVVLIYSDGISTHWSLDEYEGLAGCDPSLIAAVIYRDKKRGRDDASVLAIRERRPA